MSWQDLVVPVAAGFGLSALLCLGLVATQRWHGRFTLDGLAGVQKFHRVPTPRIGGLGIALAFLLVWPLLPPELAPTWAVIGIAGLPALAAGLGEDVTRRVGVKQRLLATMAAGIAFALMTGYVMDDVDLPGIDRLLAVSLVGLAFTGFAMGGVANAINIIDGFNGLAAGALLIMLAGFGFVAWQVGDALVLALALLYGALVLGFFVVNFPHGRIFLGDGGAYFCGFLLATLGVLLPARNDEISAWTAILICAYPVIETLASIWRKSRRDGHSAGRPDRVHFHMLAHRHYARRVVPASGPVHLRNPVTAMITWILPALTTAFVVLAWQSPALSAACFFLTVFVYRQFYRIMSLNPPRVPVGLARLF